ncbi:hypothetical protein BS17DRAFT_809183 [Gyrodon lividus]|nr:hypothetical protein BS17DRAFT_809183 [Gyrodon lividus]
MNNGHHNNNDARGGHRFPHGFHIGTTLQNVLRNINHAFTSSNNVSGGELGNNDSEDRIDGVLPLAPTSPVVTGPDSNPVDSVVVSSSSMVDEPSLPSVSVYADIDMPPVIPTGHSQPDPQRDDDDSMPDLRSVTDSSDESDAGAINSNQIPVHPVDDDHDSAWTDEEDDLPPLEPIAGSRRARVEDDVDDARDRRHPSERVGDPPPPSNPPLQPYDPQQPPLPPGNQNTNPAAGVFPPLFGLNPWGSNAPGEDVPMEHTGEGTANPLPPPGNNPNPGRALRAIPILTAGFTFTIPLSGPALGNQDGTVPTAGPQGPLGMDTATREELFASFAAFFQEVQNLHASDELREDPERAKKLVAGLEVVPLGLVKRLERVGGAPGGHVDSSSTVASSPGCAICWDTLLDAESDGFDTQDSSGDVSQSSSSSMADQNEIFDSDAMNIDPTPASHPEPVATTASTTPASTSPSSEGFKVIALPCAHVFHASCLLPWFTRARQATCPTCRFNIDPENLTYSPPPRRAFNYAPAQPNNATPNANAAPAAPQAAQEVPSGTVPPINSIPVSADAPTPAPAPGDAATSGPAPPPATAQAGPQPAGHGFNTFINMPGLRVFPFPGVQIPPRPAGAHGAGNGNQRMPPPPPPTMPRTRTQSLPNMVDNHSFVPAGIDIVTIGLDMFVNGPAPGEGGGGNAGAGASDAGVVADGDGTGDGANATAGGGTPLPLPLPQEVRSLIEGLLGTARNMIPQMMNAQGLAPAPPVDGAPTGPQPQPQSAGPPPQAMGPQPVPPASGPQAAPGPQVRPNFFRPTRPMPPRRERKTWTLPPGPGPSLRQRVEQREREAGLRCSDTSCGIGPSDEDPCPQPSPSSMKQVSIHPIIDPDDENDLNASVCAHTFHPACLVSAERVAGWGGEDKTKPLVEASCPVCRAVGCVTRDEWEEGAASL